MHTRRHTRSVLATLALSAAVLATTGVARAEAATAPSTICKGHPNDVWTSWWSNNYRDFEVEYANCSGFGSDHMRVVLPWASDSPCWWFHGSSTGMYHVKFSPANSIRHADGTAQRCGSSDGSPSALYRWEAPGGGGGGGGWKMP